MKRKLLVVLYGVVLVFVSVLPQILEPWLVAPSGTIKIIGLETAAILAAGLLFKPKLFRWLLLFILSVAIVGDIELAFATGRWLFAVFALLHGGLLAVLMLSKSFDAQYPFLPFKLKNNA